MERKILDAEQLTIALKSLDGWTTEDKFLKKHLKTYKSTIFFIEIPHIFLTLPSL